jgi:hypothetical protein
MTKCGLLKETHEFWISIRNDRFRNSQSYFCRMFNQTEAYFKTSHVFLFVTILIFLMNLSVVARKIFSSMKAFDTIMTKFITTIWNDNVIILMRLSSFYDEWRFVWSCKHDLQWCMYLHNLLIMWRIYTNSNTFAYVLWNSQWWLSLCVI